MSDKHTTPKVRKRTRALTLKTVKGTTVVRRAAYHMGDMIAGTEVEALGEVRVPLFDGPAGLVGVAGSVTKNMGDFNSVKVEVRIEIPAYAEKSELDRAYGFCSEFVDAKISNELALATGSGEVEDGA